MNMCVAFHAPAAVAKWLAFSLAMRPSRVRFRSRAEVPLSHFRDGVWRKTTPPASKVISGGLALRKSPRNSANRTLSKQRPRGRCEAKGGGEAWCGGGDTWRHMAEAAGNAGRSRVGGVRRLLWVGRRRRLHRQPLPGVARDAPRRAPPIRLASTLQRYSRPSISSSDLRLQRLASRIPRLRNMTALWGRHWDPADRKRECVARAGSRLGTGPRSAGWGLVI